MRRVEKDRKSGCWLFTGYLTPLGYGKVGGGGKHGPVLRAHRVTYEHFRGPIPDGMQLDHLCRVPRCVNPDHLEPVTFRENLDRSQKGPGPTRRIAHYRGIACDKRDGMWFGQIKWTGARYKTSRFKTPEEARAAYVTMCERLGVTGRAWIK